MQGYMGELEIRSFKRISRLISFCQKKPKKTRVQSYFGKRMLQESKSSWGKQVTCHEGSLKNRVMYLCLI